MEYFKKKIITFICMMFVGMSLVVAQTNTTKHTVERGETLASIAKRYATTEAKIIELNPDAAQFVYVGMELTIPVEKIVNDVKKATSQQNDFGSQNTSNQVIDIARFDDNDYSKWGYVFNAAYGILPKPKGDGVSGSNYALSFSFGANYHFNKLFYVGARIGYSAVNTNTLMLLDVADYHKVISDNHMIFIPLEIGSKLYLTEDKVALVPYVGIDINCIVKSTMEEGIGTNKKKKSIDPDKRVGMNGRIGLRLNLWGWYLGGSYVFSFDDNYGKNDGFPEISLGFSF